MKPCTICGAQANFYDSAKVLKTHEATYLKCSQCNFVFVENPHWLKEAYQNSIASSDVGLVRRNLQLAKITQNLIRFAIPTNDASLSYLDYAGGYGLFTRLMRDQGYPFCWADAYSENLFAKEFEIKTDLKSDSTRFGLITAFEFAEHLVDPLSTFKQILDKTDHFFFSTELIPASDPKISEWWYFNPLEGQHICFWTVPALKAAAFALGPEINVLSNGRNLHLFSRAKISKLKFKWATSYRLASLLGIRP